MKKLLVLALLLAAPLAAQVDVVRAPIRVPVTQEPTYPEDGVFVYQPDPACSQYATSETIPNLKRAVCFRAKAIEYLIREVSAKRIVPGPDFRVCDYAWSQPASWGACVEYQIRREIPEIRFGQSPYYVVGSVNGVALPAQCVAGVSYPSFIRVSLSDPSRVMSLVSWETSNVILFYVLGLYTSADGPLVAAATDYARAACPAF